VSFFGRGEIMYRSCTFRKVELIVGWGGGVVEAPGGGGSKRKRR
jgi:hypothetical protein